MVRGMIRILLAMSLLASIMSVTRSAAAQEAAPLRYREFELGSNLAAVAKLTGADPSTAKVVHSRPSVMTDLEWRPRYRSGSGGDSDPVAVMLFRFLDNRLYMIVVEYDRRRTEGMTPADMVRAISETYGISEIPSKPIGSTGRYAYPDTPLGVWGDGDATISLVRVSYPESYRLVVASLELQALAKVAADAAARLDKQEAPQRELDRQKKEASDSRAATEKVKTENQATFKP